MYLSEVPDLDTERYFKPNLLGGSMEYDVDLSDVGCGCISALYTILMPAANNFTDPFKYCDAANVDGHSCPEFDIMEANKHAFHVTSHKCNPPNSDGAYGWCDSHGQCTMDVYYETDIQTSYGPFDGRSINTQLPFHVKTEFHESDGDFVGYTTTLSQSDRQVVMSTGDCSWYLNHLSSDMT